MKQCLFCELYKFQREIDDGKKPTFRHIYRVKLVSIGRKKVNGKWVDRGQLTHRGYPARFCPVCGERLKK